MRAGIGACAPFQALMRKVVKVSPIKEKYEQVRGCVGGRISFVSVVLMLP